MEALIPGLPDEIAEECLIRVAYDHLPVLAAVCRRWRQEIRSPDFLRRRRLAGVTRPLLVLNQALLPPPTGVPHQLDLHHTLFDPTSGTWRRLPPLPPVPNAPPSKTRYAGLAAVGHAVVNIGWWRAFSYVRIYDFITAAWREGLRPPGPPRLGFACASDGVRRIFVAGGLHRRTKALIRSAMVYDVEEDRWEPLPDMARGGTFLKGVFHAGVFHVISKRETPINVGYVGHYMQLLDVCSHPPPPGCGWSLVELNGMMTDYVFYRELAIAYDGRMYYRQGDKLHVKDGQICRPVLDLPPYVTPRGYLTSWRGGLLMAGSAGIGEPLKVYTLMLGGDEESLSWTEHRVPKEFERRTVWQGCWLEI